MTGAVTHPHNRRWDKESVIAAIRYMDEKGAPLNPQAVRRSCVEVYLAAHRYCGGWAKALKLAGIDPATVYLRQMRSVKEAVDGE